FFNFYFPTRLSIFFNTIPMKQHFKTHVNKGLFKKVVNEFNIILKKVNNIICHKTANAGGIYFSSITQKRTDMKR
ncbi:hypothetical protein, partial [Bacillus toyonensis]|uniref:hypothetical protein n=1 Tax=Bacillus toyonensis TaxID=155322 RepID=UPI001C3ED246